MNWKLGLLRTWLAVSLIWTGFTTFLIRPDLQAVKYFEPDEQLQTMEFIVSEGVPVFDESDQQISRGSLQADLAELKLQKNDQKTRLTKSILITFLPPLLTLVLGLLFQWVINGFRQKQ